MLCKYLKWVVPVISTVGLLNSTIVVGSDFLNWADSISYCPECESASYDLRSGPEERGGVRSLPECADPTPPALSGGDIKKAGEWIKNDLLRSGKRVNDDSSNSWQETEVEDIDVNLPDELAGLVNHGAKVALVDESNNMGLVTTCASSGDIQFASTGGLSIRSGKARGVIAIPPESSKKMASQRSVRNAFVNNGIPIDRCNVCNDSSSSFVTKQKIVETIAAIFQVSTTTVYSNNLVPPNWKNKTERLYKDELEGLIPGIVGPCQQSSTCGGGGDEKQKFNTLCGCLENGYPNYFPGPVKTEEYDDGYGITIYLRSYSIGCGACGQYSESALASYQDEIFYSFDWDWQYLAPIDDAGSYFCQ